MCMPNYWIAALYALIIVSSKHLPKEKIIICLIEHYLSDLFSLFIGRILFQLYYTICEWWTANAGILYEKEKHIYSSFCGYSDDHYDHL